MLYQVEQGEIIYVVGRLLQPFCSHALYRVRVLGLRSAGNECLVIHGVLIDFKDSPVQSYPIEAKQLFRWETSEEPAKLSKEDIERIVRAQGVSVGIRKIDGSLRVDAWKYLRTEHTEGKKRSIVEKHYLGTLAKIELMSEDSLASMVRAKFSIEAREEAEKVEVLL